LSARGADVDLVAPAAGSGVVESGSLARGDLRSGLTQEGTSFSAPIVTGAAALVWAKHPAWDASRVASALVQSASKLPGARPNVNSGWGRLNVAAALKADPPADLDEPNDWASAVRTWGPLPTGTTLGASVGGNDDPLDGYPVDAKSSSHVTVTAQGDVTVTLLASSAIDEIGRSANGVASHAVKTGTGSSVRLAIPHAGQWAVVVTAQGSQSVRYHVRVG
jgi:subtilisin family serine protease